MSRSQREQPELRGDEEALYVRHAHPLERVVGSQVRASALLVEEACSFAWLQLVRTQPERDYIFSWLVTVAKRQAWRILEQQRERNERSLDELAAGEEGESVGRLGAVDDKADVEERVLAREELREALTAIGDLHPRRRRRLELFVIGYSYKEIAEMTGTTPQNVSTLIAKAKRQLRERGDRADPVSGGLTR